MANNHIFLTGVPRSGTTWISNILNKSGELDYIHEPDNERHTYSAQYYKRGLPRFPHLNYQNKEDKYLELFRNAFYGDYIGMGSVSNKILFKVSGLNQTKIEMDLSINGINTLKSIIEPMPISSILPKTAKKGSRRLVKSVHSLLYADEILNRFSAIPIIVIRHPAGVISSYLKMNSPDIDRDIYENKDVIFDLTGKKKIDLSTLKTREARGALQLALFYRHIANLSERHSRIIIIKYEEFCQNPIAYSKNLFKKLKLSWTNKIEEYIQDSNRYGQGYETNRLLEEQKFVWKKRLAPQQVREIQKGYTFIDPIFYKKFAQLELRNG